MPRNVPSLIVPVYLNQRIVFDLLAMVQDGLSEVTRITTTEFDKESVSREAGATFGLTGAISSLFKVDLSGRRTSGEEGASGVERNEERVHTPSSLLYKLRQMLKDEVHALDASYNPEPGHLVEFSTTLRRNPLIEAMDTMAGMLDIAVTFGEQPKQGAKKQKPGDDFRGTKRQMEEFREKLAAGSTVDIVSEALLSGHTAVVTLEEEFLRDPTMSNLVEGHFTVLGKVIRVVEKSDESISLLRKTALSAMPIAVLSEAFSVLSATSADEGFTLPKMEWEINGPAIQVLPIGIYA